MSQTPRMLALAVIAALAAGPATAATVTNNFSNSTAMTIPDGGGATPAYPSVIAVSGLEGTITEVTVTLTGYSHTFPDDVGVLLVSPGGQKVVLMDGAGDGTGVSGLNLTFSASAGASLPNLGAFSSGTYLPTSYYLATDVFPSAPAMPYSVDLTSINGPASTQNGNWQLFVYDFVGEDGGSISGGWSLSITQDRFSSCADEGFSGDKLKLCKLVCEVKFPPALRNLWIQTWARKYEGTPPCIEDEPVDN